MEDLVHTMPLFSILFFVFTFRKFKIFQEQVVLVGEFLILVGSFQTNTFMATLAATWNDFRRSLFDLVL
jgi:NADH:ubiquinone oxidoreductase subunit 4 (subunit M)